MRRWLVGALGLVFSACDRDPTPPEVPRATALAIRDGNDQSGPAGGVLPKPLSVTANDAQQNPVPGTLVRFRVTRGSQAGTVVADSIAVAGVDGVASMELRLGTALDSSIVEASLSDVPAAIARFRALATPPPRLDGIIPTTFAAGDTVRVRGQFFSAIPDANIVLLGTARARVISGVADSSLTVVVPPCVANGGVSARVAVGSVLTNPVASTFVGASGLVSLRPLEGLTVSGSELSACIQLAGSGASYVFVPQSAAQGSGSRRIDFTLSTNTGALGSTPLVAPLRIDAATAPATLPLDRQFDRALRGLEADLVDEARTAGLLRPAPGAVARSLNVAAPPLGSQRSFQVLSKFDGSAFRRITTRLRFAGDHILLYVDVDQPPGALTDADLRTFGELFDRTLYDVIVRTFGSESDIDANGRVIFILTPVVNSLTSSAECSASGFITGFHYGLDLLPGSANSNGGEIFYALVPDLGGTRSCEHSKADVERLVPATFVHEFQHMISFGQHVVARGGQFETLWLNEGLSHIAEEIAGKIYESRFPPPAGRTDPNQLFPDSAQGYLTPLMRNAQRFLEVPGATAATSVTGSGSLSERGGAWLFLRWLGDQKGEAIYGRLVQTSRTGVSNVEDKANESFSGLFGDFATAVYTDSIPGVARALVPSRLKFTTRNFRRIFKRFADIDQTGRTPPFPFTPMVVSVGQPALGSIALGSMAYFQLTTPATESRVSVRFSRADLSPFLADDNVQIGIFRLP